MDRVTDPRYGFLYFDTRHKPSFVLLTMDGVSNMLAQMVREGRDEDYLWPIGASITVWGNNKLYGKDR